MEGINWSDLFTAMDKFLLAIVDRNVLLVYVVLFAIFFSETGLVFMTFLPGDSLLFVVGAVAAQEAGLHVGVLMVVATQIGAVTPPVAVLLFVSTGIAQTTFEETVRYVWPFLGVLMLVLAVLFAVPVLSTWIPHYVFG